MSQSPRIGKIIYTLHNVSDRFSQTSKVFRIQRQENIRTARFNREVRGIIPAIDSTQQRRRSR